MKHGELVICTVSSAHTESSWGMLTDSAEVVLSRRIRYFTGKNLKELLSAGDQVRIELGCDSDLYTEFEGYVSLIDWGVPVTIRCEDEVYSPKRKTASYFAKNVTLKKLLTGIAKGHGVKTNCDAELGTVRYPFRIAVKILNSIQKKTNLYHYFVGKTLYCGNTYSEEASTKKVKIVLERNTVSQGLNEANGELQVKVASTGAGGKELEARVEMEGSKVYNLTYNKKGKSIKVEDLKKFAKSLYESLRKQKYRGGAELLGIPATRRGMTVGLKSEVTPKMNGYCYVEKATKGFSDDVTYRQKLESGEHTG